MLVTDSSKNLSLLAYHYHQYWKKWSDHHKTTSKQDSCKQENNVDETRMR